MNNHFYFVLIVFVIVILSFACYNKIESFNKKSDNIEVLLFYTEWCKFSQQMLPVWDKVIKAFNSKPIKFIKYDCDKNESKCKEFEIDYLPTIYLIKNKEKLKYTDDISYEQLGDFIFKNVD